VHKNSRQTFAKIKEKGKDLLPKAKSDTGFNI
jgi:hypothetical protein